MADHGVGTGQDQTKGDTDQDTGHGSVALLCKELFQRFEEKDTWTDPEGQQIWLLINPCSAGGDEQILLPDSILS